MMTLGCLKTVWAQTKMKVPNIMARQLTRKICSQWPKLASYSNDRCKNVDVHKKPGNCTVVASINGSVGTWALKVRTFAKTAISNLRNSKMKGQKPKTYEFAGSILATKWYFSISQPTSNSNLPNSLVQCSLKLFAYHQNHAYQWQKGDVYLMLDYQLNATASWNINIL